MLELWIDSDDASSGKMNKTNENDHYSLKEQEQSSRALKGDFLSDGRCAGCIYFAEEAASSGGALFKFSR